ncbi:YifB family Mg chelatase-like AAA ATPase [Agromyces archimandritae]|uniref:YifB family Mg chelatase-like AAA ATPase n=1 Tax=Agromyces archimandritae TaxID=2781962 RepID=A0A975IPY9_9MICO|nr:YifB family Mg chelatase-like AAA ATPase [Agromyces archimandritae]QTX04491.1 YifB family Mg chelatase-like AAA ATPase [Agromyces archimandritae]
MGVVRTASIGLVGLEGTVVEIEADLSANLPALVIIGLPDASLAEARERVRSAAVNAGCALPNRRLTVNLSPASLPKHGSGFDLAIAVACLAAAGAIEPASIEGVVHLGELGLDGRLRPIDGVLPAVLAAMRAGFRAVMVPTANLAEAELVPGIRAIGVASLRDALIHHGGTLEPVPVEPVALAAKPGAGTDAPEPELAEVIGNVEAVDALLTAAAGGHHLYLLGPPGAGKTMLASRLPGLLPDLGDDAALEAASLASLAGRPPVGGLGRRPPYEAPHHTATAASIVGGGSRVIRPGAAARASHGVLFLDEAPEFPASVLDVLRQPLESGVITIHRSNAVASFPASFQLVIAANPCPCGGWGSKAPGELVDACVCPSAARRRYLGRISGPLMDRVDLRLWVPRVTPAQLRMSAAGGALTTEAARARVVAARGAAAERLAGTPWSRNAEVPGAWIRGEGGLHPGGRATAALDRALERGSVTMRGYDRTLKVAWTLADLAGLAVPGVDEIGQALYYREGLPT